MFTGIVQGVRRVNAATRNAGLLRLRIDCAGLDAGLQDGASVAINGTCLTVATHGDGQAQFDVIPETLLTTNLGTLRAGDLVNIERSARMSDEVGGHRVSGHVSAVGVVDAITVQQNDFRVWIKVPPHLLSYLLLKGFVALNGASLTISAVERTGGRIQVSLIPETLTRTTFGQMHAGDRVNVEIDPTTQAVVDTVRALFADPQSRATLLANL